LTQEDFNGINFYLWYYICPVIMKVDFLGFDGNGGPCYIGSGCFHRRDTLCGHKNSKEYKADWKRWNDRKVEESVSVSVLEETCKELASCTYEKNTQWGKEVSLSLSL
jgi:hypothetical protein